MPFDFEQPLIELEEKINQLKSYAESEQVDLSSEIALLEAKLEDLRRNTFAGLTRWQRVQLARAQGRPTALDVFEQVFEGFLELHGDRNFRDDPAIVGGLAYLVGKPVVVIGEQKGRDTKGNIERNFGMPHPEGYRKAMRLMDMAERFSRPVITIIDTIGAYPGLSAEERGQAWAIAESIQKMGSLKVPTIALVLSEGGSGGALALGVGNRVLIMENAWYSVISPESCAAILWRDAQEAPKAAEALKLIAPDLLQVKVVDEVIPEPKGGAHRSPELALANLKEALIRNLTGLEAMSPAELKRHRYQRFRQLGAFAQARNETTSAS
jgi:acetyl-CoA carboxylase carboxyl transferase subunit alpha